MQEEDKTKIKTNVYLISKNDNPRKPSIEPKKSIPNKELVARLKELLEMAETGELQEIAGIGITDDLHICPVMEGYAEHPTLILGELYDLMAIYREYYLND